MKVNIDKELRLSFGAICAPLSVQLKEQGLKFNPKVIRVFQKNCHAAVGLKGGGFLTPSASQKIFDKIAKKIIKHLEDFEG